jgi:hypothetical protein
MTVIKRTGVDARLLDLRDYPMPFFDQPVTPAMPGRRPYDHEVVKKWTAAIAQSDGFIIVTPEYNYGPAAVAEERHRLGVPRVESQGGWLRELWLRDGRTRRPAAPRNSDRAPARAGSFVSPHPCRHPVGSLPARRCRRRTRPAGGVGRSADRRSLVVDGCLENGAQECLVTAYCAVMMPTGAIFREELRMTLVSTKATATAMATT